MIVNFLHIYVWDTMIILEDGKIPDPQCPWCDIMLPWKAFNGQHTTITQCSKGAQQKRNFLVVEDMR